MRTAVDVHNFLVARDLPHELVSTPGRVRPPDRVAAVLGLEPEQVGRVALFRRGDELVAVLVPADRDPDPARVADVCGDVEPLSPDSATSLTEFLPEAMPPVALPDGTLTLLDERLSSQEILYFPGGEATSMLKIRPADLVAATGARVVSLAP